MNAPTKPNATKPAAPARPPATAVKLAELERDPAINCRAGGVSERVAAEYVEAMKAGAKFPPVVVFRDSAGTHWLADGFHRCRAVEIAGGASVAADVREGDRRDALLYAAGANAAHGARRTNKDKRRAVAALLADPEWASKGDAWIAERCAVSDRFVAKLRPATPNGSELKREGRDGKVRRVPKRKARRPRKANPARAVKDARRGLERVARGWPKGEPVTALVEAAKAWLDRITAMGAA